jgi:hypothetical protein
MAEWIWFATSDRIKHIALMRASAASSRFGRVHLLLIAFALGALCAAMTGFRLVSQEPAFEPSGTIHPRGDGWIHVVESIHKANLALDRSADLWWNPTQTGISFITGSAVGLLLLALSLFLIRAGMTVAHAAGYRGEQRMTAALHYSTAWMIPALIAGTLIILRPITLAGVLREWRFTPTDSAIRLTSGVIASIAGVLWWFWLIRMGFTAPPDSRNRVAAFFAIGVPLIIAIVGAAWWFGLTYLHQTLFKALQLDF